MKIESLNVSLIQTHLIWEHPAKNRAHLESYFQDIPADCHLVVLPEMFTSGFTMNPQPVAESADGETVQWLQRWSKKLDAAICGSMVIQDGDFFYNRFLFVEPDGKMSSYDKRHTFNMAGEGKKYKAGTERMTIDYLGWKIFPQICYDLRFPVFSRNTTDYDLIIYVANWPKARVGAWDALLKARAIENMSYCIGVNRVGKDGNGLEYVGHSAVYDVLGSTQIFAQAATKIISTSLSKSDIVATRSKLPFLEDRDFFTLE